MSNTSLNYDIGLEFVNHLLNPHQVVRQLNDGTTKPGKTVDVFRIPTTSDPGLRRQLEALGTGHWISGGFSVNRLGDYFIGKIDCQSLMQC